MIGLAAVPVAVIVLLPVSVYPAAMLNVTPPAPTPLLLSAVIAVAIVA